MRIVFVPLIVVLSIVPCQVMIYVVDIMCDMAVMVRIGKGFHCADQARPGIGE